MSDAEARSAVVAAAVAMSEKGLSPGTSGNVSARHDPGMLITPSAVPYARLRPDDVVALDLHGRMTGGGRVGGDTDVGGTDGGGTHGGAAVTRPSSEWQLHAAVYRARPEVGGILHAHAPFCTALACVHREIPAFHYMVAVAGGDTIRCAPYATFGTAELADGAVAALEDRTACLLAHHGMVALADDPAGALALAEEVESLAAAYWRALQVGEPRVLPREEMAAVLERFRGYRAGT